MSVHAQTVIQWFEQFAPKALAVEGDKIGLQIGTLNKEIERVMITLDVTEEVVEEAINKQVDLIIAHHPILYRPLAQLRTDQPIGRMIEKLIKHDVAVYAAHTNLDIAEGGVNDWLAQRIGLLNQEILSVTYVEALRKLVVFVPAAEEQKVREALGNAGAGWIGKYSHCTFRSEGIGTFLPQEGSQPHIGIQGKLEQVQEVKIETIYPVSIEKKLLQALVKAHPYEEVAYDIYPVEQKGKEFGLGRIGKLHQEITLKEFAEHIKQVLDVPFCRVVGPLDAKVKKVAVLGGDGNKYVHAALFKGADVMVTGDVYFHTAQDALMSGLYFVDPGHHVEKVMIEGVRDVLQQAALEHKASVEVIISEIHTEPFQIV